jgi:integrase
MPHVELLDESRNVRTGIIEPHDFAKVLAALEPPAYAAAAEMAFITGWRLRSEVLTLTWPQVDLKGGTIRIDVGVTKGGEGRTFPITARLRQIFKKRRKQDVTSATLVFHEDDGTAIHYKHFYARWHAACAVAKVKGLIPHDLRRSAVREMERRRIPRQVSMKLVGHRTESIYRRYAIVSEAISARQAPSSISLQPKA